MMIDVVAVAVGARVEVDDTRVGGDDRRSPRPGDVDARVDAVRIGTAWLVLLEPVAVAAEALADAAMTARGLRPLELAGATTCLLGCRSVFPGQRGDLLVDRNSLRLQLRVLVSQLSLQLALVGERGVEGRLILLHVGHRHLLLFEQRGDLAPLYGQRSVRLS